MLNEVRQSLRAQPNVYGLGADVDAFDQQLHNADLLRREQFIQSGSSRSKASHVGFFKAVQRLPRDAPRAHDGEQ